MSAWVWHAGALRRVRRRRGGARRRMVVREIRLVVVIHFLYEVVEDLMLPLQQAPAASARRSRRALPRWWALGAVRWGQRQRREGGAE